MGAKSLSGEELIEASISDVHKLITKEKATFKEITQAYIDRIVEYNSQINGIISINTDAVGRAKELDKQWRDSGPISPIHGIPVILKDNIDTGDLPTTAGSVLFEETVPPDDAFITKKIRNAGGIIIAKANLGEFASGSLSSLGGQTHNPYDISRDTGGSSSGTGASIAANFGVLGVGTDTGGSVRHPSGFCSLVGLRPTRGLLSRNGIIPLSNTQDTAGPMTRTVADAAILLDIMVDYDPKDQATTWIRDNAPESYSSHLRADGLQRARLGVLRQRFGPKTDEGTNPEKESEVVTNVIDSAIQDMAGRGAEIIELDVIPNLAQENLVTDAKITGYEFRREFTSYLDRLGSDAPIDSPEEIVESDTVEGIIDIESRLEDNNDGLEDNLAYLKSRKKRRDLKELILKTLQDNSLDALVYPMASRIPSRIDEERLYKSSVNSRMASSAGFPAITVPAGYDANWGTPVGVEFLAGPFEEARLFELAFSYEQASRKRVPPENFGSLEED